MPHGLGFLHLHTRKRIHKKEHYPSRDNVKRLMDKSMYGVALAAPIFAIPQVLNIWIGHSAAGIQPITFMMYSIVNLLWVTYGFLHKEKQIMLTMSLFFLMNSLIVVGTIIYR